MGQLHDSKASFKKKKLFLDDVFVCLDDDNRLLL